MLFGSLVELHVWLHSCLCFSSLEKLFLKSWLNTSSIASYLLSFLKLFLIAISTNPRQLGGSIEKVPRPSIASWQLVDRLSIYSCVFALFLDSYICRHCVSRHLSQQMSRHLYLSRITKDLYIDFLQSGSHFLNLS